MRLMVEELFQYSAVIPLLTAGTSLTLVVIAQTTLQYLFFLAMQLIGYSTFSISSSRKENILALLLCLF